MVLISGQNYQAYTSNYEGFFLIISIVFIGCNKDKAIKTYSIPKHNTISQTISAKKENLNLPFYWNTPKEWSEGKKTPMRLASYNVPFSDGVGDLSISNFSGDGGGVLANINRWRGQLDLPAQTMEEASYEAKIGQSKIGEFQMYKIMNKSNENTAFLCSILQVKHSTIFIKLVTTITGVKELENDFMLFCSSFNYSN